MATHMTDCERHYLRNGPKISMQMVRGKRGSHVLQWGVDMGEPFKQEYPPDSGLFLLKGELQKLL